MEASKKSLEEILSVEQDAFECFPHNKRVGNYLIGKTVGEGSFAKVKEAIHIPSGEKVAVKVIDKSKCATDIYLKKNLRREAQVLQTLHHPNIIELFEAMETDRNYYMVTEYIPNSLMQHMTKRKTLDEVETRRIIRQIIQAVYYMHTCGVIHRDLKIENIMLTETDDIKIIDFGLSNPVKVRVDKVTEVVTAVELSITQCGSPAYAAPELIAKQRYGNEVDAWSIGVNMFALLVGKLPFTVSPFNIRALHTKMLKSEMNALPEGLTTGMSTLGNGPKHTSRVSEALFIPQFIFIAHITACRDLINKLLNPEPATRIKLRTAMNHPWLNFGYEGTLRPTRSPGELRSCDLNMALVEFTAKKLKLEKPRLRALLLARICNNHTATYKLLERKLERHGKSLAEMHLHDSAVGLSSGLEISLRAQNSVDNIAQVIEKTMKLESRESQFDTQQDNAGTVELAMDEVAEKDDGIDEGVDTKEFIPTAIEGTTIVNKNGSTEQPSGIDDERQPQKNERQALQFRRLQSVTVTMNAVSDDIRKSDTQENGTTESLKEPAENRRLVSALIHNLQVIPSGDQESVESNTTELGNPDKPLTTAPSRRPVYRFLPTTTINKVHQQNIERKPQRKARVTKHQAKESSATTTNTDGTPENVKTTEKRVEPQPVDGILTKLLMNGKPQGARRSGKSNRNHGTSNLINATMKIGGKSNAVQADTTLDRLTLTNTLYKTKRSPSASRQEPTHNKSLLLTRRNRSNSLSNNPQEQIEQVPTTATEALNTGARAASAVPAGEQRLRPATPAAVSHLAPPRQHLLTPSALPVGTHSAHRHNNQQQRTRAYGYGRASSRIPSREHQTTTQAGAGEAGPGRHLPQVGKS